MVDLGHWELADHQNRHDGFGTLRNHPECGGGKGDPSPSTLEYNILFKHHSNVENAAFYMGVVSMPPREETS